MGADVLLAAAVVGGVLQAFYIEVGGAYGDAFACYLCAFDVGVAAAHNNGGTACAADMAVAVGGLFATG